MRISNLTAILGAVAFGVLAPHPSHAEDRPPIGLEAGQMYPDFLLPTLDGEVRRFSDYRSKKILLFHFASW